VIALSAVYVADRNQQLTRTERESAKAKQVRQFVIDLFGEVHPDNAQGTQLTPRDLVDRGAARLEGAADMDPEERAALTLAVAQTYFAMGEYRTTAAIATREIERVRSAADLSPEMLAELLNEAALAESNRTHPAEQARLGDELVALAQAHPRTLRAAL